MHNQTLSPFSQQMKELHDYVKGMLSIVNNAQNDPHHCTQPLICLANETKEIFCNTHFEEAEQEKATTVEMFCETIQTFLFLSLHTSSEWTSTIAILLEKTKEHIETPAENYHSHLPLKVAISDGYITGRLSTNTPPETAYNTSDNISGEIRT